MAKANALRAAMGTALPLWPEELRTRGGAIGGCDFVLVTGDAYVDHPSFANGVLARVLEAAGYSVGVIAEPDVQDPECMARFGRPRLAFLVSAGNLDSCLSAYTAHKLPRSDDPYAPGGVAGLRPMRATIVYCNLLRRAFGKVPIIIGGIEASQRRLSHYDFWDDKVRRSILLDSNADLLVYGMGEATLLAVAERLRAGEHPAQVTDVRGTAYVKKDVDFLRTREFTERFGEPVSLLRHEDLFVAGERVQERAPVLGQVSPARRNYATTFAQILAEQDPRTGRPLLQRVGELTVVVMPPALPQSTAELDRWYDLPYTRMPHPSYEAQGGVPAWLTTQHSIVTHRGCAATCSFCAIAMHQGRIVQSRSPESILREAAAIVAMPSFRGTIADVGGPSANMWRAHCPRWEAEGACTDRDCLAPELCPAFNAGLAAQRELLARVRAVPGVKHAFIQSGLRYDLLLDPEAQGYLDDLVRHHVSGQLKVAPEHHDPRVLALLHKPSFAKFEAFQERFRASCARAQKKQFLTAYFVSSLPGCTLQAEIGLAEYLHQVRWSPEQVQDFIPTPMTMATAMFYSGLDPQTLDPVFCATTMRDKQRQRALLQFNSPKMHGRVRQALREAGRHDLIGRGTKALVPPGK